MVSPIPFAPGQHAHRVRFPEATDAWRSSRLDTSDRPRHAGPVSKPGSFAFARIRAEVKAAACAVPRGRVTTYGAIARHLEITARHVVFVLSGLTAAEAEIVPWHRVVAQNGELHSPTAAGILRQRKRLTEEGLRITRTSRVEDFDRVVFRWPERREHPGQSSRGPYSDPATPPLFATSRKFGYPEPVLTPRGGVKVGSHVR
jgi:alkylated DNA nucleotide flippase Atl1